jgi:NAD(P)-dependent dehydrogenase (short-subunit alcohol dehydrogenase family)
MAFLKGTFNIVTGGGSGIGLAIAKMLVASGGDVWICGPPTEKLESARRQMPAPERCHPIVCDVSDPKAVVAFFKPFHLEGRPIDVLVNAAGILTYGTVETLSPAMLEQITRTNYYGAVYCCQQALPAMKKRQSGHIFNLCSVAGIRGTEEMSAYCATKFALRGFSQSLHHEVKRDGIKVTNICPGYVWTPMVKDANLPKEAMVQPEDIALAIQSILQMSKNAVVTEIVIDRLTTD